MWWNIIAHMAHSSTGKISHSSNFEINSKFAFIIFINSQISTVSIVWKIFFVGKNLRPTLLNKNFHSTRVITFETFLTKLDFYFVAIREINYRPRSRDPWDNLQESWQESTRKNKRSETGNSNLIIDTPVALAWFETPRGSPTRVVCARGKV